MTPPGEGRNALLAAVGCYGYWGIVPLVFQLMNATGASTLEIVAHRMFWSVFSAAGFVLAARQWPQVRRALASPTVLAQLLLSTMLLTANWGLYVWAVVSGRTLAASLGYYIIPLISMAAGALIFHERLDRFGLAAMGLAAAGVALQALAVGHFPWISLGLALSFGGYGVVRKRVRAEAQTGLFIEGLFMTLPGAAVIVWLQAEGQGHFLVSPAATLVLVLAGPLTVIPLVLFNWATRRLPLSTLGFLQFLGPTLAFVIGVTEGEPFGWLRAASFVFIWVGAAVFAFGAWRASRTPLAPVAALAE